MSSSWDPKQRRRETLYERILLEARSDLTNLKNELEQAISNRDSAHIMAIKDTAIMLFTEAILRDSTIQKRYADAFNSLQVEFRRAAQKYTDISDEKIPPSNTYCELSGFLEALYGSLVVRSALEPSETDLAFVTHTESHEKTLRLLYKQRLITPSSVADYLEISPQRGSQLLKELQERDLVEKMSKIGRSQFYRLTRNGITVAEHLFGEKYLLEEIWNAFLRITDHLENSSCEAAETAEQLEISKKLVEHVYSIIRDLSDKNILATEPGYLSLNKTKMKEPDQRVVPLYPWESESICNLLKPKPISQDEFYQRIALMEAQREKLVVPLNCKAFRPILEDVAHDCNLAAVDQPHEQVEKIQRYFAVNKFDRKALAMTVGLFPRQTGTEVILNALSDDVTSRSHILKEFTQRIRAKVEPVHQTECGSK